MGTNEAPEDIPGPRPWKGTQKGPWGTYMLTRGGETLKRGLYYGGNLGTPFCEAHEGNPWVLEKRDF